MFRRSFLCNPSFEIDGCSESGGEALTVVHGLVIPLLGEEHLKDRQGTLERYKNGAPQSPFSIHITFDLICCKESAILRIIHYIHGFYGRDLLPASLSSRSVRMVSPIASRSVAKSRRPSTSPGLVQVPT